MKNWDKNKPSSFIAYVDANNLYCGLAMSQKLPTGGFDWIPDEKLETVLKDRLWWKVAGLYEVTLKVLKHRHDYYNDFSLAPERRVIDGVEKLVTTLDDKERYVLHYRNLLLYEDITAVYRVITFEESAWMTAYVSLCTNLRTVAKNAFEKEFFKLMTNSVFGKTMENIRKHINVKLVTSIKKARKFLSDPSFERYKEFPDTELLAIHCKKTRIEHNKPIYLGMSILDLSKLWMYKFYYNYLKPKYGDRVSLLYTDTDTLILYIKTEDFYDDIRNDVHQYFDTSEFPEDHPSGIPTGINKKVPELFKDECQGKIIKMFVGLSAKQYAVIMDDANTGIKGTVLEDGKYDVIKKCKGVKSGVVEKDIKSTDYVDCCKNKTEIYRKMNNIRSYEHILYTETENKRALSHRDTKRIPIPNSYNTLAIGHWRTKVGGE